MQPFAKLWWFLIALTTLPPSFFWAFLINYLKHYVIQTKVPQSVWVFVILLHFPLNMSIPKQNKGSYHLWNRNHFKVLWRLLVEKCIPYIGLWSHNFLNKRAIFVCVGKFFFWDCNNVQPTVDNGEVSRRRSVAVNVDCWHLNGTSTALYRHFNWTSMPFQWYKKCEIVFDFLVCVAIEDIFCGIL